MSMSHEAPATNPGLLAQAPAQAMGHAAQVVSGDELQDWLVTRIAESLGVRPSEVDIRDDFASFGLDSKTAVGIAGELEQWLGRPVETTLIWDHPTIEAVVHALAASSSTGATTVPKGTEV